VGVSARGRKARPEQVGGDEGFGVGEVGLLGEELFRAHDAGVVDEHVEGGEIGCCLGGKGADGGGVFDVEVERLHAGVGGSGRVERLPAASGDDDLVAEGVKRFSQSAANAGAAAGDEDGVAGGIHGVCCLQEAF
jgi:hypothetical protein